MVDSVDIQRTIDKVRRDFPRIPLVMTLCALTESLLAERGRKKKALTRAEIQKRYRLKKKGQMG